MNGTLFDRAVLRLFRAMNEQNVRFLVVGTVGVALQVGNLGSVDVDIWVEGLGEPPFLEAVHKVGAVYIRPTRSRRPMLVGPGLETLDIETHMSGIGSFAEEYAHVRWVLVDDTRVPVLALDRIIQSKIAAGRPKDLAVVSTLRDFQRTLEVVGPLYI